MTTKETLLDKLNRREIVCERLYRIDLERFETAEAEAAGTGGAPTLTVGRRPVGVWKCKAMLQDLSDRTLEQILNEIFDFLADKTGRWQIRFFYWEGYLTKPVPGKLMGRGDDFLYSTNPAADRIAEFSERINLRL